MVQQTKATWLREGEDNTSDFHGLLKQRTYHTWIVAITYANGVVQSQTREVVDHFLAYYEKLLGTTFLRKEAVKNEVISKGNILNFPKQVAMIRPFTNEEVKAAVNDIHSSKTKSPGYDGYNSAFFKSSWDVIGPEVCSAILDFFHKGKLLREINHTILILLSKNDAPQNATKYHPIVCFTVLYR